MARRLYIFDEPDHFVAGSKGEPGSREFFLQARKGSALVSVSVEKAQVAALADRLDDLLEAVEVPATAGAPEDASLEEPVVEVFRVGAMALAWDASSQQVVIEAQTPTDDGEYAEVPDDAEGPDLLRVRIAPEVARGFVHHTEVLLAAGRPACPFCGQPLDPQGHFCPRSNGRVH